MWTILLSFLMRASRKVLSTHLMHLGMGALYRKINGRDTDRTKFGFLPLMAVSTNAQIGALNTESFAKRIISASHIACTMTVIWKLGVCAQTATSCIT